jgi:hypothetical protein
MEHDLTRDYENLDKLRWNWDEIWWNRWFDETNLKAESGGISILDSTKDNFSQDSWGSNQHNLGNLNPGLWKTQKKEDLWSKSVLAT